MKILGYNIAIKDLGDIMIIDNKDYYIASFDKASKVLTDFFTSIDGSCRLVRMNNPKSQDICHEYVMEGNEIIFEFGGKMVEMDENGTLRLTNDNKLVNKFMAIPKEVFLDSERFITILNFNERHRVLKMHIMKNTLPIVMENLKQKDVRCSTVEDIKRQIKESQRTINQEKQKVKQLKKQLALEKEKEQMEK